MRHKMQLRKGIDAMIALGFSQSDYARMLDVDRATVHQWYKFGRVGAHSVGRVEHVAQLRNALTIRVLRPDLSEQKIEEARVLAKLWARRYRKKGAGKGGT